MDVAGWSLALAFAPHSDMVAALIAQCPSLIAEGDGSHDRSHLMRVWHTARQIAADEARADMEVLAAATLLHDCVAVEKNASNRAQASRLSADVARAALTEIGWAPDRREAAAHAIEAHSFSAGIEARSLEAAILRDADRLDSLGALGIARTFYIAGRMESRLYDPDDPFAENRDLDDRRFALDHFATKLLQLEAGLLTAAGRRIGRERVTIMRSFIETLAHEIEGTIPP